MPSIMYSSLWPLVVGLPTSVSVTDSINMITFARSGMYSLIPFCEIKKRWCRVGTIIVLHLPKASLFVSKNMINRLSWLAGNKPYCVLIFIPFFFGSVWVCPYVGLTWLLKTHNTL